MSRGGGNSSYMGGTAAANPLFVLRYHEEMNEMAVDAQLDFGTENDNDNYDEKDIDSDSGSGKKNNSSVSVSIDGSGEVWCLGSHPKDSQLFVACRTNTDNTNHDMTANHNHETETAVWKIPSSAMREDDLDFYPDDDVANNNGAEKKECLHKVSTLKLGPRVTDLKWNPGSLPTGAMGDSFDSQHGDGHSAVGGMQGQGSVTAVDLITLARESHNLILTAWDMTTESSSQGGAHKIHELNLPLSQGGRGVMSHHTPRVSWDPHNHNLCAVTVGTDIAIVDLRLENGGGGTGMMGVVDGMRNCHRYAVTDVDYNPNKPNVLSSCGQDSLVKFWDVRFTNTHSLSHGHSHSHSYTVDNKSVCTRSDWTRHSPLKTLRGGHTHWTTRVSYNSFHDQLLLSCGTGSMVNLWRISSISSAPLMDLGIGTGMDDDDLDLGADIEGDGSVDIDVDGMGEDDDDNNDIYRNNGNKMESGVGNDENTNTNKNANWDTLSVETDGGNAPDVRVTKMEMREAIYDVAWSAADPWLFVTLGYDGNVVMNHVPSKEKYKILL